MAWTSQAHIHSLAQEVSSQKKEKRKIDITSNKRPCKEGVKHDGETEEHKKKKVRGRGKKGKEKAHGLSIL